MEFLLLIVFQFTGISPPITYYASIHQVYVGLPDTAARKEMVRYHLRGVDSTDLDSLDWQSIADMTLGWSGSEIEVIYFFTFITSIWIICF